MPEGEPGTEEIPGTEPPPPGPPEAEQLQSVTVTVLMTVEGDPGRGVPAGTEDSPAPAGAVDSPEPPGTTGVDSPEPPGATGVDCPEPPGPLEGAPVGASEPGTAGTLEGAGVAEAPADGETMPEEEPEPEPEEPEQESAVNCTFVHWVTSVLLVV